MGCTCNELDGCLTFVTLQAQEMWERRLKHYTSVFCCLEKNPGWIWWVHFRLPLYPQRWRGQSAWRMQQSKRTLPARTVGRLS